MKRTTLAMLMAGSLVAMTGTARAETPAQNPPPAPATRPAPQAPTVEDRVEYRLETAEPVRKYDIKVKVEGTTATLTGDVATAAQKAEAERLAKIDGVTRVINNIKVDPDEDRSLADKTKAGLSKAGDKITDTWINTKVAWFFVGEDTLKDSNINVDTKDHVVTLKGTVKSEAGRARAIALAKQTDGVRRVVDEMTIK
jgi:hyperosmotically inducible protein